MNRKADRYDVFLSYNRVDRELLEQLADRLEQRGIKPWLDVREVPPGGLWQEELEQQILAIRAVAVCVGASGIGPWQNSEMRAYIDEFLSGDKAVIPVLLPSMQGQEPLLLLFLKRFN